MNNLKHTLISILFLFFWQANADDSKSLQNSFSEIEISGFMDFVSSYNNYTTDKTDIALGQAEIDLAKTISDSKSVEVAIAYNNDESKFELGAAILNLSLNENLSFSIGQFDVPFGIDYKTYASIDRRLITAPRVVELTHEGWNDIGAQLYFENNTSNFSVFIVNGFESSAEITEQVINISTGLPEDQITEVNTTPSNAVGARVGFNILSNFEIGSSLALGLNADNKDEMMLFGTDIQFDLHNFIVKGEYIYHSVNRSIQKENNQGYYIQSLYDFGSYYITSRYGSFQPDGIEWVGQLSVGGGIPLSDGSELRLESLIHETSDNNKTMIQFVTEF